MPGMYGNLTSQENAMPAMKALLVSMCASDSCDRCGDAAKAARQTGASNRRKIKNRQNPLGGGYVSTAAWWWSEAIVR